MLQPEQRAELEALTERIKELEAEPVANANEYHVRQEKIVSLKLRVQVILQQSRL